jgi:glycine cleavage system protein P-like pyridoxal-binding family
MADMGRHSKSFGVVSAAPFGSSAILPISWAYIKVKYNVLYVLKNKSSCFLHKIRYIRLQALLNMI